MVRTASAVIAAQDEAGTLGQVLKECRRLRLTEIIVVANGPGDAVVRVAESGGARVVRFHERLGHDVGRAIGAVRAVGESVLFLDADIPIPADQLHPFLRAVESGVDVALNRLDPFLGPPSRLHPVNAAKRFLNATLGRPDLGCASLTAVPHALSRRTLERLGAGVLTVPPRAQAMALAAGLRVEAVHPVDVITGNPQRPGLNQGAFNPVDQLILGDHLEAIHWLHQHCGSPRGSFPDLGRRRELLPP